MSGISPISGTPVQPLQLDPLVQTQSTQTTEQAQEQSTTQLPPQYEALPFQRLSLATMGLSNPVNSEDFSALLADVEDKLDKTMKNLKDQRAIGLAAGISSALGGLIGNANAMKALTDEILAAQAKIDSDKAKLVPLQSDLATQQNISASLGNQINSQQNTVNGLNSKLAGMKPTDKDYAATVQARDSAVNTLNSLVSQKNGVDARIASDQKQINDLNTDISNQTNLINTDTPAYQALQGIYIAVFAQLASASILGVSTEHAGDQTVSNINKLRLDFVDQLVKDFSSNLEEKADASSLMRKNQFEDIVKDRVKQAAAVLISGLVDVLSALSDITPGLQVDPNLANLSASTSRLQIQG